MDWKDEAQIAKELEEEIFQKLISINMRSFLAEMRPAWPDMFIRKETESVESLIESGNRKKREHFCFLSKAHVDHALTTFFSEEYNIRRIAKMCAKLSEDEKFKEEIDAGIYIGVIHAANGEFKKTSLCEITLRVRRYDGRNTYNGMPFDIISLNLIEE